ncbi:MAG: EcsC family protein [Pirellulales bacterium]
MNALTAYEQQQVRQIAGFKAEHPLLIVNLMEKVTHPIVTLARRFIPENSVREAIDLAYKASEIVAHRAEVAAQAGVDDIRQLRNATLELCDQLAEKRCSLAGQGAMTRGAVISTAGGVGAILGMEVMFTFALKTIHNVGYCYGYAPEDPGERDYAMGVLLVAAAGTAKQKQEAIVDIQKVEDFVLGEVVEEATLCSAEALANEALGTVTEGAAEEMLAERVFESGALRAVPLLGIVVGAVTDAAVAEYIGHVAKRMFQERWLRAQGKVDIVAPDDSLVRNRWQRAGGVLSACSYWTSYLCSFTLTFPIFFVVKRLPTENAAHRGLKAGGEAAARDVETVRARLVRPAQAAEAPVATAVA